MINIHSSGDPRQSKTTLLGSPAERNGDGGANNVGAIDGTLSPTEVRLVRKESGLSRIARHKAHLASKHNALRRAMALDALRKQGSNPAAMLAMGPPGGGNKQGAANQENGNTGRSVERRYNLNRSSSPMDILERSGRAARQSQDDMDLPGECAALSYRQRQLAKTRSGGSDEGKNNINTISARLQLSKRSVRLPGPADHALEVAMVGVDTGDGNSISRTASLRDVRRCNSERSLHLPAGSDPMHQQLEEEFSLSVTGYDGREIQGSIAYPYMTAVCEAVEEDSPSPREGQVEGSGLRFAAVTDSSADDDHSHSMALSPIQPSAINPFQLKRLPSHALLPTVSEDADAGVIEASIAERSSQRKESRRSVGRVNGPDAVTGLMEDPRKKWQSIEQHRGM